MGSIDKRILIAGVDLALAEAIKKIAGSELPEVIIMNENQETLQSMKRQNIPLRVCDKHVYAPVNEMSSKYIPSRRKK